MNYEEKVNEFVNPNPNDQPSKTHPVVTPYPQGDLVLVDEDVLMQLYSLMNTIHFKDYREQLIDKISTTNNGAELERIIRTEANLAELGKWADSKVDAAKNYEPTL